MDRSNDATSESAERLLRRSRKAERRLIDREEAAEREVEKHAGRLAKAEERLARATERVRRRQEDLAAAETVLRKRQDERALGPGVTGSKRRGDRKGNRLEARSGPTEESSG